VGVASYREKDLQPAVDLHCIETAVFEVSVRFEK